MQNVVSGTGRRLSDENMKLCMQIAREMILKYYSTKVTTNISSAGLISSKKCTDYVNLLMMTMMMVMIMMMILSMG
jgi:hypothetical protein